MHEQIYEILFRSVFKDNFIFEAKLRQNKFPPKAVLLSNSVASWLGRGQGGTSPLASECQKISEIRDPFGSGPN